MKCVERNLIQNQFLNGDFECKIKVSFFQNFSALPKLFFFFFAFLEENGMYSTFI